MAEVKSLARSEREATADLIAHLAELDARRLYLGAGGFSSLFSYCTDVLRLSEAEAYNRIEAARAARRFPAILDMLGDGALTSPQCASSPRTWMTTTNGSCSRPHPAKAGAKSRSWRATDRTRSGTSPATITGGPVRGRQR